MNKLIIITLFLSLCINNAYAASGDRTPWWDLKRHWDNCKTRDDKLCIEYMTRVQQYYYTIDHNNPMRKVAVLPPPAADKFAIKSLGYFERDVLFNMKEMEEEYLIPPKKWVVVKGFNDSYKTLKEDGLYDKYQAWVEEFISYRSIDKGLLSKIANSSDTDTLLLLIIGYDRPGAAAAQLKSEVYYEERPYLLNVYLFDAREGKIIWEYCCELETLEQYLLTRWRGIYRKVFKTMPVE